MLSPVPIFRAPRIGFFARILCDRMLLNQRPMNPAHCLYKTHTQLTTEGSRTRTSTIWRYNRIYLSIHLPRWLWTPEVT